MRTYKKWAPEEDALLGTMPDSEVASYLGISRFMVNWRRRKLGITAFRPRIKWTSEMDALLGTMVDWDVADELGMSQSGVHKRRTELGIPASGTRITKWVPKMDTLLGTMFDWEVALELDISRGAVRRRRYRLGVSAYRPSVDWTPGMEALLGTMTDTDLAKSLSIFRHDVRKRRLELGIRSWSEQNRVLPEELEFWMPEARRFYANRRIHRKEGLLDDLTYEQWKFALEFFEGRCAYCSGEKTFLRDLGEDHLIPLSQGGTRTALNIIPCCPNCNSSKGDRKACKWIFWKFGRERGQEIADRIVAYLTEVKKLWYSNNR